MFKIKTWHLSPKSGVMISHFHESRDIYPVTSCTCMTPYTLRLQLNNIAKGQRQTLYNEIEKFKAEEKPVENFWSLEQA